MRRRLTKRAPGIALTTGMVGLTLTTAVIHFTLGGVLFLLNAAGYLGLAVLIVIGASVRHPIVHRFGWFPRLALTGYTAVTIVGYLVIGPYIALGWITKGVELTLLVLIVLDVRRVHGGPRSALREAWSSTSWLASKIRRGQARRSTAEATGRGVRP